VTPPLVALRPVDVGYGQEALRDALVEAPRGETLPALGGVARPERDPGGGVELLVVEASQRALDQRGVDAGRVQIVLDPRRSPPLAQQVLDAVGGMPCIVDRAEFGEALDGLACGVVAIATGETLLQFAAGV
jgi:hypothetical protein